MIEIQFYKMMRLAMRNHPSKTSNTTTTLFGFHICSSELKAVLNESSYLLSIQSLLCRSLLGIDTISNLEPGVQGWS